MHKISGEYPVHLLEYPLRLFNNPYTSSAITIDEYVFGTYFALIMQGINQDDPEVAKIFETVGYKIDSKADALGLIQDPTNQERMMKIVSQLKGQFNEQITTSYVRDFLIGTDFFRHLLSQKKDIGLIMSEFVFNLTMHFQTSIDSHVFSMSVNLDRIKKVLKLTEAERRLIEMNYLFSTDVRAVIFKNFLFSLIRNPSMFDDFHKALLGDTLNDSKTKHSKEVHLALSDESKPIILGIIDYDFKTRVMGQMSEFWTYVIANDAATDEKFFSRFVDKIKPAKTKHSFSGAIAKVTNQQDEELIKRFLKKMSDLSVFNQDIIENANILCYGSRKLDKIGYITKLLEETKVDGYQVQVKKANATDIPSICYIAQKRLASQKKMGVLIIEKAEQALTKSRNRPSWYLDMFGDDDVSGVKKEELDSDELLLVKNPMPTIWMTNAPSSITQENVGRFLLHCELRGGSRKDRRESVEKEISSLGFSKDLSQRLSKYLELNVEQIKSASRLIQLLKVKEPEETLVRLVANSQRALDREKVEEMRESVTKYSLDLLNISGNMSIAKIIQALKRKQHGTLCFYGLPGTGKTQLAEYIAMELDMPILIKPASEMLNMYLGETEKAIAAAFEEAKADGAIFLLDEADSFLRDRAMAHRSWEVTQVNELLQRMERFPGIFICATNLFEALDAAALRRFTFKLEFHELTPEQRMKMLENETSSDFSKLSPQDHENLLMELALVKYLTPGDFATVKRQAALLGEQLSVNEWINRLQVESKAKLVGIKRNAYSEDSRPSVTTRFRGE